jgi:ribonuclease H / adenosylcobalamin/alpha-ribazole phosphatase
MQYFDGGSRANPGPAGCGAAVYPEFGSTPIATASAYLGTATSNEAEYQGLILALKLARDRGASRVAIHGDSKVRLIYAVSKILARLHPATACMRYGAI